MGGRSVASGNRSAAVRRAANRVAEQLEARALLSGTTAGLTSALLSSVPRGLSATSAGGRLELAVTPVAGRYTPDYVQLDENPTVTAAGTLAPFATAAATGLSPAVMRHAYGVDQITFGSVVGDGTGQTIAIVDAYDYPTAAADLHSFDQAYGLADPPSFTKVNETGGTTLPGVDTTGVKGDDWEVEEALDIEWTHAMAPGASILLVEANAATNADLITNAVGYARTAPGVVAVSMSFGASETTAELALDSTFTTPAGHTGVTFLASTGDTAVPAGYPSYSPNVVAVGGTTLTTDGSGNYVSEAGWADGGGGISAYETQPAYQKGTVTQSATYRTVPDVSFDADPNTGASIYDTYDFGTATPWLKVGGTSLSAPSVAGLIAIADQGRTIAGGATLNGVNDALPALYAMPAAGNFHDVTTGSNGYAAGVGYDLVTGRGSPVANALVPRLAASGPFVTAATPTGVLTAGPTSATFTFSGAMDTTSFSPAADIDAFTGPGGVDLRSSVTGYTWLSSTSLSVTFVAPTTAGTYAMTIGPAILSTGGQPMDQNANGVAGEPADTFTETFAVDPNPLTVTATTPAAGGLLTGAAPTLSLQFNQPVDPATVSTSDLTLSRGTVTAASLSPDGLTATFTLGGLTTDGPLTVTLAAGAVSKPGGIPLRTAYSATYTVDLSTLALPTPFVPLVPAGSLAYAAPAVSDTIYSAGDAHWYAVSLDAGQRLSAVVTAAAALRVAVAVVDPSGNVIGSAAATAAGQTVAVQSVPVATAGTYQIVVAGTGGTVGTYALNTMLNAVAEAQGAGGAAHATTGTAQGLDGTFTGVGGAGRETTVAGTIQSTAGAPSALFTDNFESGLGGFTLDNTIAGGLWHLSGGRGSQSGHSATQSLYFGTGETAAGGGTYNTGARAAGNATSPAITLPATAETLSFNYVLQTENSPSFDKAQVQVSTDGGVTYATLATYNAVAESSVWKGATVSLAAYAGKTVTLRWSFDTVDAYVNAYEGWYVDDVSVAPTVAQAPVPAVYAFTLNAGDTASLGLKATGTSAASDVKLLDAAGNVVAQYAAAATGLDRSIADFVAPTSGTYYAQVTGTVGSGYDLVVTTDASFDTAASAGTAAAQPIGARQVGGDQRVVGHVAAGGTDTYALTLAAGATLSLATTTPGDGAGQPVNTFDPRLQLLNSAGTVVATNDNGAADGRNASLTYAVPAAGTYYVVVSSTTSAVTSGDYVLAVDGASVVAPALAVSSITPAKGAAVNVAPTQVTVTFSAPFDARTLSPSLLTIDGVAATAVTQTTATTATFTVAPVTAQGTHTVAIAGGLTGLRGGALAAYAGSFTLDTVAPTVVATSIANGATVAAGPLTFTATFSEPMLASNLDATDVTLLGSLKGTSYTPTSVAFSGNNTVLTVTYASLPEDAYTLTLLTGTGRFQDAAGNNLAANYVVTFGTDVGTQAVPTLASVAPMGSLAYTATVTGAITTATDTDAFTIPLTAGQTLTLVDQPTTTSLMPTFSLAGPGGTGTLVFATALVAGKSVVVESLLAPATGTYTVTVGGASGTLGIYSVLFYLDAAVESEVYGGPVDDTIATAQNITAGVQQVPGAAAGVAQGAVVGTIDAALSPDVYAVQLTAGTTNTFSLASFGRSYALTLTDGAGNVLATGTAATGTNASGTTVTASQVANFIPATTTTYYLRVTGTTSGPYTLVATTNATYESDLNVITAAPQPIDPTDTVVGALDSGGDVDLYQFAAVAGAHLTLSTVTPGYADTLAVQVQLYDPSGKLVAGNYGGAADGRNALLTFTTSVTGVYQARITSYGTGLVPASGTGEYLLTVTADKHPTTSPSAPVLLPAADTGVSATDGVTRFNDATPGTALQFSIGGTLAGDTVELFIDGTEVGSAVATGATTAVTAAAGTPLADGAHTVTARQVDPSLGESVDSRPLTVTVKTATPATPPAPVLQAASDSGTLGDGITTVTTPAFTVAVATPYFRFYVNGTMASGTYASGTAFTVPTALTPGTYALTVVAVDAAGNASAPGPAANITVVPAPAAPTGLALDPGSDTGVSSSDGITSASVPTFDVTVPAAGVIHIRRDGVTSTDYTLVAAAAGTYALTPPPGAVSLSTTAVAYSVGSVDYRVRSADLNGDGRPDLIMLGGNGFTVMLNLGGGTYQVLAPVAVPGGVNDLCVADFTGDGVPDVIVGGNYLYRFAGNGDGTFAAGIAMTVSPYQSIYDLVTADLNGDGKPDLLADGATSGSTYVLSTFLNTGGGTFVQHQTALGSSSPTSLYAADLTGDGRADVVIGAYAGLTVLTSNGDGTFAADPSIAASDPLALSGGDFNGDGKIDLAVATLGDSKMSILLGNGDGTFQAAKSVTGGSADYGALVGDFNGDGHLDFVTSVNTSPGTLLIAYGNGDGTLQTPITRTAGTSSQGLAMGDFNGDGSPDVAMVSAGTQDVYVFLSTGGALSEGTHTYTAWETDAAGDASASVATSITVDRTPPATPSAPTLTAASDTGVSATDGITNVTTPAFTITGGGPYFRVYRNGTLVSGTYATGTVFTSAPLADGTYTFTVVAVDAAGNASAASTAKTVTIDTAAPAVPPAPALTAASDSGISQSDGITNVTTPSFAISGAAPYYNLYRNGMLVSGSYASGTTFTSVALADGTYTFALQAVDAAGNTSAMGPATSVAIVTKAYGSSPTALDPTFGTGGTVTSAPTGFAALAGVAVAPDGRVVAVGPVGTTSSVYTAGAGVFRYTAAGVPDPTFGTNGVVTSQFDAGDQPMAVAVQPDGKIVVAGETSNFVGFVARYNVNGSLDTSFAIGGVYHGRSGAYQGLALQSDGSIVVVNSTLGAITRLTPAGTLDGSFGSGGVTTLSGESFLYSVLVQPDGKLVAAGWSVVSGTTMLLVARFTTNGQLDPTFGTGGSCLTQTGPTGGGTTGSLGYALALQSDGKLVMGAYAAIGGTAASPTLGAIALRFTSAGSLDSTFGTGGIASLSTSFASGYPIDAIAVRPDGHILIGGSAYVAGPGPFTPVVVELNADGSTTSSFGTNGVLPLEISSLGGLVTGIALQSDGSAIVGQRVTLSNNIFSGGAELGVSRIAFQTALSAPTLPAASDTGISSTDGVTSVTKPTLNFVVPAGYYADLYLNGVAYGAGYISGGTYTATTALPDGTYSFTYAVIDAAGNLSAQSPAIALRVDTTAPTATLGAVTGTGAATSVPVTFSEPVYGLTATAFTLTVNGGANLLDGTQTLTTTDNVHFTLGNLAKFDAGAGAYVLSLVPSSTVTDVAGNALVAAASTGWTVAGAGLSATADGQAFYLRMDSTDSLVQVWQSATAADPTGGAPTFTVAPGAFAGMAVLGNGHANVTVTVDESNGMIPTTAATFLDGGTGASGDVLVVHLAPGGVTAGVQAGEVAMEVGTTATWDTVAYAHVASVVVVGTSAADSVQFNGTLTSAVTYDGGGGGDTLQVNGATVSLVAGTYGQVQVNTGSATLLAGPAGGGIQVDRFAGLSVNGGTLTVATAATPADRTLVVTGSLSLAGSSSRVDLGGNDMIVHQGALGYIGGLTATGYAGGTWSGVGLMSSAAAADPLHLHAIGVIGNTAGDGTSALNATFDGQPAVASDVLVRYTLYGDVNLNGVVDVADYTRVDAGFLAGLKGWANGDLNGDGVVDGSDYTLMDNAFNLQPAAAAASAAVAAASPGASSSAVTPAASPAAATVADAATRPAARATAAPFVPDADPSDDRLKRKSPGGTDGGVEGLADAAVDASAGATRG
jgi:uncharacterized delta-60 repeat protein